MRRWIGLGVAALMLATAAGADAQDNRAPITMREDVYEKLGRAQAAAEKADYERAFDLLDDVKKMRNLEPYEEAKLYTAYGYTYFIQEKYPVMGQRNFTWFDAYEHVLALEKLPDVLRTTTLYTLAQLQFQQEDYEAALGYLERWLALAANPGPEAYVLLGQAYYQLERFQDAVPALERAMEIARQRQQPVRESW